MKTGEFARTAAQNKNTTAPEDGSAIGNMDGCPRLDDAKDKNQMTPAKLRSIRLNDDDWRSLQALAWWLVPDSEMPADARKDAGKVTQLIRMIARKQLAITQADDKPA